VFHDCRSIFNWIQVGRPSEPVFQDGAIQVEIFQSLGFWMGRSAILHQCPFPDPNLAFMSGMSLLWSMQSSTWTSPSIIPLRIMMIGVQ
jgi:hypothetical protein